MKKKSSILFLVSMIGVWFAMPSSASEYVARGHYEASDRHAVPVHFGRQNVQRHHSRRHSNYDQDYWGHERRHYRKHSWRHYKRHHGHHRDRRVSLRHDRHHGNHEGGVKIGIYYKGYL